MKASNKGMIVTEKQTITPQLSNTDSLYNFQKRSAQLFAEQGLPKKTHENWLYWTPEKEQEDALLNPLSEQAPETVKSDDIHILNGCLKSVGQVEGVQVGTDIAPYMDTHTIHNQVKSSPLSLLPNIFFQHCIIIDVQKSQESPIHLHLTADTQQKNGSVNTKILLIIQEDVQSTVTIHHHCHQDKSSVTNTFFETVCKKNSQCNMSQLLEADSNTNFFNTVIHMHEHAYLSRVMVSEKTDTLRMDTEAHFHGEQANLELNGLMILNNKQQVYNHLNVNHYVGNSICKQLFKSILCDEAISEFSGLVYVAAGAHGTDSQQSNKNLLFSDKARALSRPQLRIDADDVECAHGSTVGQLDPEEIHYIKSRGLSEQEARQLLTFGFAEEVLLKIKDKTSKELLETKMKSITHDMISNV